jgi:outer membrane protein assembly factor BamA
LVSVILNGILKLTRLYDLHFVPGLIILAALLISILPACNPTKYVPADESLLNENHVILNNEGISKSKLIPYIKQQPNKKIFGARFHLGLYNLSKLDKENWFNKWLRNIGEEPVIFDPYAMTKSKDQIKSYVASKGYFDAQVSDTTSTEKQKTDVYYNVELKPPYTVRNIYNEIADSNIKKLYVFDSMNCLIERGKPYDVDVLQAERSRFERFVKDHGFFGFSGDHIYFRVDSTIGNRQVDITYGVRKFMRIDELNKVTLVQHPIYKVKDIYIYPDFIPKNALEGGDSYLKSLDTTFYKGYYFVNTEKTERVKYDLILQSLYLKPGATYNFTNTEQSQSHLLTLKVYRLVTISYNELSGRPALRNSIQDLNCNIQLTPLSQQSYKVELEGTNSAGNIGGAVNLIYQHKNLFHGAQLFNLKLKGAIEALAQGNSELNKSQEYGLEASLRFPEFLLPFIQKEQFIKKYNPSTILLAAYNYQNLPFYTRIMSNATFGYDWKSGSYKEHIVSPLQFNVVKLLKIDSAYQAEIESSSYLAYSYKDVMILGGKYSFIFNNQKINKSKDFWFLRINAEASGNLLGMIKRISGAPKTEDGTYEFLRQPFAQYIRTDMDLRYNYKFNNVGSMVYRGFFGIGIPYGNSKALPFEKQYFSGGANGIRAWQVRTLGPGSYAARDTVTFINQTADIKLEANAEYRFKLFWILEGAVFLDAGNIWTYKDDPARPGAQFKLNKFYKDIALGTGAGLRFDFEFVLGRIDLGMKLRDPSIEGSSKWIVVDRGYNFKKDFTVVIGIGYPF